MPSVCSSLQHNYVATQKDTFVARMLRELQQMYPRNVRVHVSGDFYNVEYAEKWLAIFKRYRAITFYFYTRSWRNPAFNDVFQAMHSLPNVHIWWSADAETWAKQEHPPLWPRCRVAYMLSSRDEVMHASIPEYANIIFRQRRSSVVKYYRGTLVCPVENGVVTKQRLGCSECKLCFTSRRIPKRAAAQVQR